MLGCVLGLVSKTIPEAKKQNNKDENVHRFAISAIRGELLERERERERERLVFGYGLPIIHSKD